MDITKLALTPPMGWNSWDCFSVSVTEEEVKQNADFVARHLKKFGWEYIVVDLAWFAPGATHETYKQLNIPQLIDEYGRLIPDPEKFPSSANGNGFKPLADYVHGLGLKFGIHIMRGIPVQAVDAKTPVKGTDLTADQVSYNRESCPWYNSLRTLNFAEKGAQEYYNSIFELYASWGVDYIKADDMNSWHEVQNSDGSPTGEGSPYRIDDIEGVHRAIENCGRPMVLSLSPGGPETTNIRHLREHSNLWRISADFWDEWGSLKKQMERCAVWAPFSTPGHWPDADMLPLGYMPRGESGGQDRNTNFNQDEQVTLITLWAMFKSPLMFGGHLPKCDDFTISLLTNQDVIDINQHSKNNRELYRNGETVMWTADDEKSDARYIAVFNISDEKRAVNTDLKSLMNLEGVKATDLWSKEGLGQCVGNLTLDIEPHGVRLVKLS
ncbi:glycoside hydrolase family 27 protein [Thermophagus sp. OGC60D27]|uniref:glycoside hydrolase family 27 protein n=1 Tax=Thermophagus sp. OGC60D27 TaxID=3458415 RepID=UPI0040381981